jgi:hypothetical protein
MLAPLTTILGAASPPMASKAMVRRFLTSSSSLVLQPSARRATGRIGCGSNFLELDDLAAVVITAGGAKMVRALQLPTVWALAIAVRRQRIVRPALAAPRFRYLPLGDSHDFRFPDPMKGASESAS